VLVFIHGRVAISAVLFALVLGTWAAWDFMRGRDMSPSYWGALIIGEVLMIGQGVIGLLLVLGGNLPVDLLHFLYGVLVALSWPAVYIYTNARTGRSQVGLYALVSFFIFGLAVRAIMTG
jgi:heme A synthase